VHSCLVNTNVDVDAKVLLHVISVYNQWTLSKADQPFMMGGSYPIKIKD
jgi:hypothetical protein